MTLVECWRCSDCELLASGFPWFYVIPPSVAGYYVYTRYLI